MYEAEEQAALQGRERIANVNVNVNVNVHAKRQAPSSAA